MIFFNFKGFELIKTSKTAHNKYIVAIRMIESLDKPEHQNPTEGISKNAKTKLRVECNLSFSIKDSRLNEEENEK